MHRIENGLGRKKKVLLLFVYIIWWHLIVYLIRYTTLLIFFPFISLFPLCFSCPFCFFPLFFFLGHRYVSYLSSALEAVLGIAQFLQGAFRAKKATEPFLVLKQVEWLSTPSGKLTVLWFPIWGISFQLILFVGDED